MSAQENDFDRWQGEVWGGISSGLDSYDFSNLEAVEKEQRRAAFGNGKLNRLFEGLVGRSGKPAFYRTTLPDIHNRSALFLRQYSPYDQLDSVRVVVADEVTAPDFSGRLIQAEEFVVRRVGSLITAKSVTVPKRPETSWGIGQEGFVLGVTENKIAVVRHGPDYHQEFPTDTPSVTTLQLLDRRVAAERLAGIAGTLSPSDRLPVIGYSFRVVLQES